MNSSVPPGADTGKELCCCEIERPGDSEHVQQSDVSFPALCAPEIGTVHAGAVGELFLRDAEPLPLLADTSTEPGCRASNPPFRVR